MSPKVKNKSFPSVKVTEEFLEETKKQAEFADEYLSDYIRKAVNNRNKLEQQKSNQVNSDTPGSIVYPNGKMYFAVPLDKIIEDKEYIVLAKMEHRKLFEWFDSNTEMLREKIKVKFKEEKNIDITEISKDELVIVPAGFATDRFESEKLVYKGLFKQLYIK